MVPGGVLPGLASGAGAAIFGIGFREPGRRVAQHGRRRCTRHLLARAVPAHSSDATCRRAPHRADASTRGPRRSGTAGRRSWQAATRWLPTNRAPAREAALCRRCRRRVGGALRRFLRLHFLLHPFDHRRELHDALAQDDGFGFDRVREFLLRLLPVRFGGRIGRIARAAAGRRARHGEPGPVGGSRRRALRCGLCLRPAPWAVPPCAPRLRHLRTPRLARRGSRRALPSPPRGRFRARQVGVAARRRPRAERIPRRRPEARSPEDP